jgi:multicomponent Na+:H+ antiporter subunit C
MSLLLALGVAVVVASGVYLTLSSDLFRSLIGIAVLGAGVNLVMLLAGRVGPSAPPIVTAGAQALEAGAANPLPQALVLTAVVIGFALLAFAFVLAVVLRARLGTEDTDAMRAAEPVPQDPIKPPVED